MDETTVKISSLYLSSIKSFYEYNSDFISDILERLIKIKNNIEIIQRDYKNFERLMNEYLKKNFSNEFNKIIDIIDNYITFLNKNKESNKENIQNNIDCYNNLKNNYDKFHEKISELFSEYIYEKISKMNNFIKNKIYEFPEIESPSTQNNTENDNIIEEIDKQYHENIYENKDEDIYGDFILGENDTNIEVKCDFCQKEANCFCSHCQYRFCKSCEKKKFSNILAGHKISKINNKENEKQKNHFLESFMIFIKNNILKCNYILKYGNLNLRNENNYEAFKYPILKDIQLENQKIFFQELNEMYKFTKNNTKENSLNDETICDLLKSYFNEDIFPLSKELLNEIDHSFISNENLIVGEEQKNVKKKN